MKASVIRKLAMDYSLADLVRAADAITEQGDEIFEIEGEDLGERLTHLLLAARVRRRMDHGEDLRDAFRLEMASVRDVLQNE